METAADRLRLKIYLNKGTKISIQHLIIEPGIPPSPNSYGIPLANLWVYVHSLL
jgi:hypothetical protein